jgi:hypothetical protein
MFMGLGKAYGQWIDHIEELLGVPESEFVRPTQQLWRNGLWGGEMVREHSGGAGLKRLACAFMSPPGGTPVKDHNAAEAGCMAVWTFYSEEGLEAAERALRRRERAGDHLDPAEDLDFADPDADLAD